MTRKLEILKELDADLASLVSSQDESRVRGMRGRRGEKGDSGLDGIDGNDGIDGIDGKDGEDGVQGDTGAKGERGEDGNDGRDGVDGSDGVDGEKGSKGDSITEEEVLELIKGIQVETKVTNNPAKGPIDQRWSAAGVNKFINLKDTGIRTVTEDTTLTLLDYTILVDSTAGNVTITLPLAKLAKNKIYNVKRIVIGNTVTVDPNGSETIDGQLTSVIVSQWDSISFQSDSVSWFII